MIKILILTLCFVGMPLLASALPEVPAHIDHKPLDTLLGKYVDDMGLVDYESWHKSQQDLQALKNYLAQFNRKGAEAAAGDDKIASLINAYNAYTLSLVLEHYPTTSIRLLKDPFDGKHYRMGGEPISADDIEHEMLRPLIGWKVHSVVVCAARSCPPLLNAAYTSESWEKQMQERYRNWLARPDLNRYQPDMGKVEISKIFDWYQKDFTEIQSILARFGPPTYQDFLRKGDYAIKYKDYHWGLNAQSDLGKDYQHSFFRSLF